MELLFQNMIDRWPSEIVARTEVEKFSGGLINEKTLANLDCLGKGVAGRIRCGRKVGYPIRELVKWLSERSELIKNKK